MRVARASFWGVIAGLILLGGAYATILRFTGGLGAATHLSDAFPWGIWIGFDLLVGVGLAAGGFVIAATVHVFHLEKYEPVARPAILTAFLGYLLVIVALLYDIGRPYRIWHPLVLWNPHSVMFEVAWCVMLYTLVLALEFSPIVLERFNLKLPLRMVRALYLPIVVAGVLLSTLHQSSLGTLFVIVPDKLHPFWYSPFLPVFFFVSAIGAGLAMTIIESFLSYQAFGKRLEKDLLTGLGRVLIVVLVAYLVLKGQDLARRGHLPLLFVPGREGMFFWGEIGLGVVLPLLLLVVPSIRENESGLFFVSLLVVFGFVINRLNVSITGMLHSETYFPKWTEMAVTLSMAAVGFIIFSLAVRYLGVFPTEEMAGPVKDRSVFSGPVIAGIWGLLLIGAVLYVYGKDYLEPPAAEGVAQAAIQRAALPSPHLSNLPKPMAYPKQRKSPGVVTFRHDTHVDLSPKPSPPPSPFQGEGLPSPRRGEGQGEESDPVTCAVCHDEIFDILRDGKLDLEAVNKDAMEKGENCAVCHDGRQAFGLKRHCRECHEKPATDRKKRVPPH